MKYLFDTNCHVVRVTATYSDGSTQGVRLGDASRILVDGVARNSQAARLRAPFTTKFDLVESGGGGVASLSLGDSSHLVVKLDNQTQQSLEIDSTAASNNKIRFTHCHAEDPATGGITGRADPTLPLANATAVQFTVDGSVVS